MRCLLAPIRERTPYYVANSWTPEHLADYPIDGLAYGNDSVDYHAQLLFNYEMALDLIEGNDFTSFDKLVEAIVINPYQWAHYASSAIRFRAINAADKAYFPDPTNPNLDKLAVPRDTFEFKKMITSMRMLQSALTNKLFDKQYYGGLRPRFIKNNKV